MSREAALPQGEPECSATPACTLSPMSVLGCDVPLMQAPLGRGAAAPLAIAVSQAGGLGTLGASWTEPAALREQIRSIGRATDRPFCVNLVLDFEQDERLEVAAEERVPWVSFSFGMRRELIARAHARGTRAIVQVASAEAARAAADAGADALIVQGVEAGGHVQSVVGLLPMLAEVSRARRCHCWPPEASPILPRRALRSRPARRAWSWVRDSSPATSATRIRSTRCACSRRPGPTPC